MRDGPTPGASGVIMESAPARAVGGKRAELGGKPDPAPPVNL